MRHLLLVLLLVPVLLHAADEGVLEKDLWYVGHLNGQPAASMHAVLTRMPDGRRVAQMDTSIVLTRALGDQSIRIEISESQRITEGPDGRIIDFRIDQDQNGARASATGTVIGDQVTGTVLRLGRSTPVTLTVPGDAPLLGQQATQDLLAKRTPAIGASIASSAPALLNNQLVLITTTATRAADEGPHYVFSLATKLLPPMRAVIDRDGDVVSMQMDMAIFKLAFTRSDGPVALLGAELAATGLVTAVGPAPRHQASNRYRLDAGAAKTLSDDEFQTVADGMITARSTAEPAPLADPQSLLQAEAQYEIDDPALRTWVEAAIASAPVTDQAALGERLRLLVRSHITQKDLGKADGSALETFRDKRGDCTEHANLLTAALRIAGIPARTEVGVVYAATYGGWVGHAWNSAYCDGRWVHLDSAYPGIPRSCYLRMATTSGTDALGTASVMMQAFTGLSGTTVEYLP